MATKARENKATAPVDHNDAMRVLAAALLDGRKKRAAEKHPVVGPLIKKLGDDGFKQLSAIAQNQNECTCPDRA